MKFRKKPIIVDAIQWDGQEKTFQEILEMNKQGLNREILWDLDGDGDDYDEQDLLQIATLEGNMTAKLGDWIIKGINGECYPCKSDIFQMTYEIIKE